MQRQRNYHPKMTVADFQMENEDFFIEDYYEEYPWGNNGDIPDRFYAWYLPAQVEYTIEVMKDLYDDFLHNNL